MTVERLLELDMAFCEAVSKSHAQGWGNGFLTDGILLTAAGDNIIGEPAIYAALKPFFEKKGNTLHWFPEGGGLSEAGDLGYTYGKFIRQSRSESDEKALTTGRYLLVWRKVSENRYKVEVGYGF